MIARRMTTITFFLVFAMAFGTVSPNKVLIAGYLTPAPREVIESTGAPTPVVGGIKMRYAGQINYTNNDGYFSFEKAHNTNTLRIIVTRSTDYDLLKNTVSHQTLKAEQPPMAIYKLEKKQGAPTSLPAGTEPSEEIEPHSDDAQLWYWQITKITSTMSKNTLSSHDLIIEADPSDIYLQDGGTRMAVENNQMIIPHDTIMVITTPESPELEFNDRLNQEIDTAQQTDKTENSDAPPVLRTIF